MKLLLDTAATGRIEQLLPYFPIAGVTTNPSILAKAGGEVKQTLLKLRALCGDERMLHVQVTAAHCDDMVAQALKLRAFIGPGFYAKIPATAQGMRAVSLCRAQGIKVTVTAVFTPMQALVAALAGADYVAPYVNRLDALSADGVGTVKEIVDLFATHRLSTQLLAASFKNVQQVYGVAAAGAQAATLSCALCDSLLFHPYTDKSLQDFEADWRSRFGAAEITDFLE